MIDDAVAPVGAFLTAHAALAPPVFGLIAFGESVAIIGIIIPATPILFLMGTLVGSGRLSPGPVLAWAMAGAITGYWLSWVLGYRLGHRLYRHRMLRLHRRDIARTRLFFRRWGGPALILGRYVLGPFQSMLPLVAGISRMDAKRFHLWNTASGVTWVILCLSPGYLTARGLWLTGADPHWMQALVGGLATLSIGLIAAALGGMVWRIVMARIR